MNSNASLPPSRLLQPSATVQPFSSIGSTLLDTNVAGAQSTVQFSLPLPDGFTLARSSEVMVQLPPGFTFSERVFYLSLPPFESDVWGQPETLGPTVGNPDVPNGTMWVWSLRTGQNRWSDGACLSLAVQGLVNPTTLGQTGSFWIRLGGVDATICNIVTNPVTITAGPSGTGP